MIGFIILCVWSALFIGIGIFMIVSAERVGICVAKVVTAYFQFVYKVYFKSFRVNPKEWQSFKGTSATWRTIGSKVVGIWLILAGLTFFIIAIWPKS